MAKTRSHFRVKLAIPGKVENQPDSARDAFWQQVRSLKSSSASIRESNPLELEGRLLRKVPEELYKFMLESVSAPLTKSARALDETSGRHIWRDIEHLFMMRHEGKFFSSSETLTAFVQLAELRTNQLRDIPNYTEILSRISHASQVSISARIIRYGSIEFGLFFGNIDALRKAFDSDFESFQVFLEVFIPKTFEDVFLGHDGCGLRWDIQPEADFSNSFSAARPVQETSRGSEGVPHHPQPPQNRNRSAVQRAEWLWKLANGSLLIPILLMVAVLYFAIQETSKIGLMQAQAMKPVIEYYQNMLSLQKASATPAAAAPVQKTTP